METGAQDDRTNNCLLLSPISPPHLPSLSYFPTSPLTPIPPHTSPHSHTSPHHPSPPYLPHLSSKISFHIIHNPFTSPYLPTSPHTSYTLYLPTPPPDGGKVEVWSLESRQLLQTIRGPAKGVTCLVLRDDHLYCGDVAGMVHIWRLHPPTMKEEEGTGWAVSKVNVSDEVPFRARCIRCLCVHGSVVYWGDDGTNIKVLDISNGL